MAVRSPEPATRRMSTHKSLNPGSYTVKGHVTEGNKPGEMADCSAPFTIQQFQPADDQLLG